jgi:hypothetical protein
MYGSTKSGGIATDGSLIEVSVLASSRLLVNRYCWVCCCAKENRTEHTTDREVHGNRNCSVGWSSQFGGEAGNLPPRVGNTLQAQIGENVPCTFSEFQILRASDFVSVEQGTELNNHPESVEDWIAQKFFIKSNYVLNYSMTVNCIIY